VFNTTFNNISVYIVLMSLLSHWVSLSYKVESTLPQVRIELTQSVVQPALVIFVIDEYILILVIIF